MRIESLKLKNSRKSRFYRKHDSELTTANALAFSNETTLSSTVANVYLVTQRWTLLTIRESNHIVYRIWIIAELLVVSPLAPSMEAAKLIIPFRMPVE